MASSTKFKKLCIANSIYFECEVLFYGESSVCDHVLCLVTYVLLFQIWSWQNSEALNWV